MFFQWSAQRVRVDSFFNGLPNGSGGGFGFCCNGLPNGPGRIRFSMVRPTGLEGFRFFSMVCPTGLEGFRFSMVCPTGPDGFVFQWFAQRVWRGFGFFFNGLPNGSGGVSEFFFNGLPNGSGGIRFSMVRPTGRTALRVGSAPVPGTLPGGHFWRDPAPAQVGYILAKRTLAIQVLVERIRPRSVGHPGHRGLGRFWGGPGSGRVHPGEDDLEGA